MTKTHEGKKKGDEYQKKNFGVFLPNGEFRSCSLNLVYASQILFFVI